MCQGPNVASRHRWEGDAGSGGNDGAVTVVAAMAAARTVAPPATAGMA